MSTTANQLAAPLVAEAEIVVAVDPLTAFNAWTEGINDWWRKDSPFWMDKERRRGLHFEPEVGGRFIEVYDEKTGAGYEIGRVIAWEPGERLSYTWRQADWPEDAITDVDVRFEAVADGTRVSVRHTGFEKLKEAGVEWCSGYSQGLRMLLGWYAEAVA
jgi:uncharacterized protein YndB with AHSA1/START domain